MKILLGNVNADFCISKTTIEKENLRENIQGNRVTAVTLVTSKHPVVKSTMFPHRNIHKCAWTKPDGKTRSHAVHILINKGCLSTALHVQYSRKADCDTDHYPDVANLGRYCQ